MYVTNTISYTQYNEKEALLYENWYVTKQLYEFLIQDFILLQLIETV